MGLGSEAQFKKEFPLISLNGLGHVVVAYQLAADSKPKVLLMPNLPFLVIPDLKYT